MNFQTIIFFPIMIIYCFTCIHYSEASSITLPVLNNNAAMTRSNNNNIQKKNVKAIIPSSSSSNTRSSSSSSIGNNQNSISTLSTMMTTKDTGTGRREEMTTTNPNTDATSSAPNNERIMMTTTTTTGTTPRSTFLRGSLLSAPLALISSLMTAEDVNAKPITYLSQKEKKFSSKCKSSIANFVGRYSDPKHPGCLREISLYDTEGQFYLFVQGQVGNPGPGCIENENENENENYTNNKTKTTTKPKMKKTNWDRTNFIIIGTPDVNGKTVTFDFSPGSNTINGERKLIMGMFYCEGEFSYNQGIYFEDGSVWNKIVDIKYA